VTASSKLVVFAIAFGIAYSVIYVICTEVNLPLVTYHPATGEIGFLYQPPGRGPAMYWYGWMLTSLLGAVVLALIASVLPESWVQRAITFGAAFALVYFAAYTLALAVYDRASIELDFLKDRVWSALAALAAAMLVTLFAPARWTQRMWPGWMWVVPLGGAIVTTYYLIPYFTR
jgi:hypothetical protein